MACVCEKCGKPCDCEWKTCGLCYMEDCCKTPEEKNLFAGGRFYPSVTKEENHEQPS